MQDQPIPDRPDSGSSETNATQDLRDQSVVLVRVLSIHPAHLRLFELVREISADSTDFSEGDRFERAVGDLTAVGLLFQSAELVLPTRAALRFNEIVAVGV